MADTLSRKFKACHVRLCIIWRNFFFNFLQKRATNQNFAFTEWKWSVSSRGGWARREIQLLMLERERRGLFWSCYQMLRNVFEPNYHKKRQKVRQDAISKCQGDNYSVKSMLLKTEPQKRIVEVNFRQMQMEHFFVKLKEFAIEMKNVCSNKELFWWNWCFILNIDGFHFKINLLPNYQVLFRYSIFKSSFRSKYLHAFIYDFLKELSFYLYLMLVVVI